MASTSSSRIMVSSEVNVTCYDVFLSFRGEDTRNSFTDHLYDALGRAGFLTFRDNDEIDRGQELKPEIERAIKASKASIVVLSQNYATSTWCLDELWLILEQRRECNHFVLPVFYHVDPSDVRKQNKTFNMEVKTSTKWTDDNVNRWKTSLTNIADLTGLVLSGPETKFIKDIVDTIYNKLDRKQVYLPPNLIGMDARVQEIDSWLKQSDVEFLVIYGMGGSGKSTLAQYIVYSNWQSFESISIVEHIGSRCKEPHHLFQLQEQIFKDVSGGKNRRIPSVCQRALTIEEVLQKKKALIVLDDIVSPSQLDSLLGVGNINKESKILITTMENDLGIWFKSRCRRCQEYKMELLDDNESLELLCLHAFGSKILMEGYEKLAKQVVRYCEGNPLALEVLGSSLSEDNSITYWESAVKLLGKEVHGDIYCILKRSYDSLPYNSDRELFLHIACFFVGMDVDYVVKILEPDYSAVSRIKTLMKRCLVFVTPNKKLMMHRLLREMGRSLVDEESRMVARRSRVWRNMESFDVLTERKSLRTMKGLALDMRVRRQENDDITGMKRRKSLKTMKDPFPTRVLNQDDDEFKRKHLYFTDSLPKMDKIELLQLNFLYFKGFKQDLAQHLRWLCLVGSRGDFMHSIFSDFGMGNLVALDMSYSVLIELHFPMALPSLKILNLKSSLNLQRIHDISQLPNLETLILWNCQKLVQVCEAIKNLTSLDLLNMTGCESLQLSFSLPSSLKRLFLKDCNLECTDGFPLNFSDQSFLQYLNLGNSVFELLPSYNHLKNLRVLDLSLCSRLRWLLCLPSTLAELYIYYCTSLEKVTFESCRFTLQEFGYEGCSNLLEIEGFIKLVPLHRLDEADLGHMKWLKEYQDHDLCLAGDDELMTGRSCHLQMLYEFNIMSTSLPDVKDPNMVPQYILESPSLSFDVPLCPHNRRLKGLNITFKYTIWGEDWAWFAKISTTNGVDMMYNPKVFGKPGFGEVAIWLSYWPIGNKLNVGDSVNVSIIVMNGLEIQECGASLVYSDDEVAYDTLQKNIEWAEILGGDLSRFQLNTGGYYLCRRDFFELMEVGRLTPGWLSTLVGDTIDDTDVRGWRKTGRPQQSYQSFTELKTIRCIVYGPESEEIYKIAEMSKSSFVDKSVEFTAREAAEDISEASAIQESKEFSSTSLKEKMESEFRKMSTKEEIYKIAEMSKSSFVDKSVEFTAREAVDISEASAIQESKEFSSTSLKEKMEESEFRKVSTKAVADLARTLRGRPTLGPPNVPVISPSSTRAASPWMKDESIDGIYLIAGPFYNDYFDYYLGNALGRANLTIFRGFSSQKQVAQTRASIIVLTKSYTSSGWCLDKLLEVLDKRRNSNHFVLPVFYHVEPLYIIEHGKDLLSQSFQGYEEQIKKVERWHAALKQVANMPNIYFPRWSRHDDDMAGIREIVSIVKHALYPDPINSPPNPTKKDTRADKTE